MNTALSQGRQPVGLASDLFFPFLVSKFLSCDTMHKIWACFDFSRPSPKIYEMSIEFIGLRFDLKSPDSHPKLPEFQRCFCKEFLGEV